jgi:hypothetical protein
MVDQPSFITDRSMINAYMCMALLETDEGGRGTDQVGKFAGGPSSIAEGKGGASRPDN